MEYINPQKSRVVPQHDIGFAATPKKFIEIMFSDAIIVALGAKKHSFVVLITAKRKVRTALGQHSG